MKRVPEGSDGRPLARLFTKPAHSLRSVSFDGDRETAFDEFALQVGCLEGRVRSVPGGSAGAWAVATESAHACAVALFALARCGARALLPPNLESGSLRRLGPEIVGVIVDRPAGRAGVEELRALLPRPGSLQGPPIDEIELDRDRPLVEFFTSGTTGPGKRVVKALCHLEDEVVHLESVFGDRLPEGARVFSTAPHEHLYGLLIRLLWPLASGRPFCATTPLHIEELLPGLRRGAPAVLVATPVQLRRLAARDDLSALRDHLHVILSSGGPLDAAVAGALEAALGDAPLEIFGSTETGGVGWRQQGRANPADAALFRPFSPVAIRLDEQERLVVQSPFVSAGATFGAGERCTLADRAEIEPDGRFRLLGRADRVVKIAERRLSLPEMEGQLREHPFVDDAALVVLEKGTAARVHAAIVPSPAGLRALASDGRRAVAEALRAGLAPHWERVLLPRAFRYLEKLPVDTRGKLPAHALAALFDAAPGERAPRDPEVQARRESEESLEWDIRVPENLAYLDGHFEGHPLVPGVVILRWVAAAAASWRGLDAPSAIEALRFHGVLLPGDAALLRLTPGRHEGLRFELRARGVILAQGRLVP